MEVLVYNELECSAVKPAYLKTVAQLQQDDFYSAEVKKLKGTPYYRAKLDYTNRLLFQIITYQNKKYVLLLEIIHQHAYEKSRFLKGAKIDEAKLGGILAHQAIEKEPAESIPYLNPQNPAIHILDKILSFDVAQEVLFQLSPPLIIIGSAGSGKTMLTLEKMKVFEGDILYVTHSPYLVQNARHLYYANDYENDEQTLDFLSYRELLETLQVLEGQEISFPVFMSWLNKQPRDKSLQDGHKLYEEFKGVITGNSLDKAALSREDYINLGIKQSIYNIDERAKVYALFEKYQAFLKENTYHDSNLLSYDYLALCQPQYDAVVIDEVQDFTPVQLSLVLKLLKNPQQFIFCGDANQIVHPNFFSWSKIKSLFYHQPSSAELIRILHTNYRNTAAVTSLANKVLKAKQARFGSIDKESHYLVESQSTQKGEIYCLQNHADLRQALNEKTGKSTRFAVIVLHDALKAEAQQTFQTPLVFSVLEAKGLEYDNVILYNLITSEEKKYREIAKDLNPADLEGELTYSRVKDKTDRSLEIYKFYINAFYVAITRAIKNVYLIESEHPFLTLLGLKPQSELISLDSQDSSLEDWQKEMHRLELQGKQEQADAIRQTILQQKTVPWQSITSETLPDLMEKALDPDRKDKEARLLLFEYALVYHQASIFQSLARINFTPAFKPEKSTDLIERKYFMGYGSANLSTVMRPIQQYGIDYRNIFNQTPLMIASWVGNATLIQTLLEQGANSALTDNLGRNSFQIALQRALTDKRYAQSRFGSICASLLPESLDVQIEGKLIKLDSKRVEFFMVQAMMAMAHHKKARPHQPWGFQVDDFFKTFAYFPDRVLPTWKKRRAYLSGLLARHEVNRNDRYNRKLFSRVKLGCYIPNPQMKVKQGEEWINLYQLIGLESIRNHYITTKIHKDKYAHEEESV